MNQKVRRVLDQTLVHPPLHMRLKHPRWEELRWEKEMRGRETGRHAGLMKSTRLSRDFKPLCWEAKQLWKSSSNKTLILHCLLFPFAGSLSLSNNYTGSVLASIGLAECNQPYQQTGTHSLVPVAKIIYLCQINIAPYDDITRSHQSHIKMKTAICMKLQKYLMLHGVCRKSKHPNCPHLISLVTDTLYFQINILRLYICWALAIKLSKLPFVV